MMFSNGKITSKELFAIVVITLGIKYTDFTSSILLRSGQTGAWILPIISIIAILPSFLALLSLLKQYKNKNLIEIIYHLTGKYLGFIIAITFFIIALASTSFNSRSYADSIITMFYPDSPMIPLYIVGMLTCYFIASRGLEGIGRIASILLPYFAFTAFLLIILLWEFFDIDHIFPLLGPGTISLAREGIAHSSILGDIIILAVLYPFVDSFKSYKKGSIFGLIISTLVISVFMLIYILVFDFMPATHIAHPIHHLHRQAQLGLLIPNVESLFFFFWVTASAIRFSIYLYVLASILANTLKLNEFEPLILPLTGLSIFIGLIPENSIESMLDYRGNYLLRYSWMMFLFIPLLLWIISYRKEKKTNANKDF
ncbi:endospore germination permease [Serpentinicella sp. ANB-PHB4]|uniref:GerAB/ArcD/ProY family transporter n=1 Tax=Serpentinicella sp. ANB-PHB4 TaxID=3074076 RepID=UPI002863B9B9|nr:endospore germination permease [Serpentinicella sp. ANB-PHB4]MDR5658354.1 endospore germination permease [Serpentinicella sp. ANB-PHB4]